MHLGGYARKGVKDGLAIKTKAALLVELKLRLLLGREIFAAAGEGRVFASQRIEHRIDGVEQVSAGKTQLLTDLRGGSLRELSAGCGMGEAMLIPIDLSASPRRSGDPKRCSSADRRESAHAMRLGGAESETHRRPSAPRRTARANPPKSAARWRAGLRSPSARRAAPSR